VLQLRTVFVHHTSHFESAFGISLKQATTIPS
jgi:hypothetical protein